MSGRPEKNKKKKERAAFQKSDPSFLVQFASKDEYELGTEFGPDKQVPDDHMNISSVELDDSSECAPEVDPNEEIPVEEINRGAGVLHNTSGENEEVQLFGQRFLNEIKVGPEFVCTCCKRLMFRHSVVRVPGDRYMNKSKTPDQKKKRKAHIDKCLTFELSFDGHEWICKTCDRCMRMEKIPSQAEINGLQFDDEPKELHDLCSLEIRLISQRLPFMQIYNLPRGGQKGIHGAVTNVPSNIDTTVECLPRLLPQCGFVSVKLKKKLDYKGHSLYQSIRPQSIMEGLRWLQGNNPLYLPIDLNENWEEEAILDEPDMGNLVSEGKREEEINVDKVPKEVKMETEYESADEDGMEKIEEEANRLRGLPYNTCLQPDFALLQDENITVCLAPG